MGAFYALLRQHYPALCERVIFLTGMSDEAGDQAFLAPCGQPWLCKPYPIAALRSAMQQRAGAHCRRSRQARPGLHALRGASSARQKPHFTACVLGIHATPPVESSRLHSRMQTLVSR